jgi:VCBS repeat-containing protein
MAKTYKILMNDGNNADIKPVRVEQGAGDKGLPVRVLVKAGWRIELQDEAKDKGLAPNQMRLKRMGKDLAIYFDNSQRADVVVEDFYANPASKPRLVGLAENGGTYEYVPQDPAVSSLPSELKDDNKPVIVSLGGAPIGEAFALSGLPVVATASGGSAWLLAGGAAVAVAAAGGGGGGGAGPAAPAKATGALAAESDTGHSNSDGITNNTTPYYIVKAEPNKDVALMIDGQTYTIKNGQSETYKFHLFSALNNGTHTPSIKVTDPTTGLSSTSDGTPITVDTLGSPDANESATVKITSISDDTGTKTDDFITSDNTLNYQGTVTSFTANGARVRLELKDSAGAVVRTEDVAFTDVGAWTWSDQATTRADGKYTLVATMVDAAGNAITGAKTSTSQAVFISNSGLTAVDDTGVAVEAGGLNNTTPGSNATGNVLNNDTTVDASVTKKVIPISSKTGTYGTLNLLEDGSYTYTVNDANTAVNALSSAATLTDTFTYTATDLTGQTKEAKLAITIQGANDVPTFTGVESVAVLANSPAITGFFPITVTDPDSGESKFSQPSVLTGKYGAFTFNVANQTWAYQVDSAKVTGIDTNSEFHDLLTVTSSDGSAYQTLDVQVKGGAGSTLPKIMNLLNTVGVTAEGHTTTGDIVRLLGSGEMFDLTSATTHISHVEKIDITGSGDNTIKLDMASLTQADAVSSGVHQLWIDGDATDVVKFAGYSLSSATVIHSGDAGGEPGYNRYIFDSAHELLINVAMAPVTA